MTTIRPSQSWAVSNVSSENQPVFAGRRKKKSGTQPAPPNIAHSNTGESLSIGKVLKTVFFGWLLLSAGTGLGVAARPLRTRGNCEPGHCPPDNTGEAGPFNSTATALQTLKCPPFPPTNTTLFTPQTYSDAPPMSPAAERPFNETAPINQLQTVLENRFAGNATAVEQALELYDDPQIRSIVPDAKLRASLVALQGTVGEGAVEAIQSGKFKEVTFADLPGDAVAAARHDTTGQSKPSILINNRYKHEDFRLFVPSIMHETLHEDPTNSNREERINTILDTELYGQLVAEDPSLAQSATELTRRYNTRLMAWINSRTEEGELRPYTAQAGNVFPGGRPLNNLASAFTTRNGQPINDTSPGNPTLHRVLQGITGRDISQPNFDAATDETIDQHQVALNAEQIVRVAKDGLKLNTTCTTDTPVEPTVPVSSAASSAKPSFGLFSGLAASATLVMNYLWGRFNQA